MRRIARFLGLIAVVAMASSVAPSFAQEPCVGDCNGDGGVTIDEIITMVNIALGISDVSSCEAGDPGGSGTITVDEILTAVSNALSECDSSGGEGLGKRIFSINSATSTFELVGLPIPLTSESIEGFLELDAGPENVDGARQLSLTDASDFIEILLVPPIGAPVAVCLRPVVDEFPLDLGAFSTLNCGSSDQLGIDLMQDHNINDIDPACETGTADVNLAHGGVCNGPLTPVILEGDPGPGALAIAPDPDTLEGGLQMEVIVEDALPCGDEGAEADPPVPFVLVSSLSRATVLDAGNVPGNVLTDEASGENFDCDNWTVEDGPGTLVLVAPSIDFDTGVLGLVDVVNKFSFDD